MEYEKLQQIIQEFMNDVTSHVTSQVTHNPSLMNRDLIPIWSNNTLLTYEKLFHPHLNNPMLASEDIARAIIDRLTAQAYLIEFTLVTLVCYVNVSLQWVLGVPGSILNLLVLSRKEFRTTSIWYFRYIELMVIGCSVSALLWSVCNPMCRSTLVEANRIL